MAFAYQRFQVQQPTYQFDELVDFLYNNESSVIKRAVIRDENQAG